MAIEARTIGADVHEKFMLGGAKEHFMQTPLWGEVKSTDGWTHEFVGFFEGETLRASAMLLKKPMPVFGKYIYYCPRGPIADYTDRSLLAGMTAALREYLRARRCVYLTIDPDVPISERDRYDNEVSRDSELVGFFTSLGWKHGGYNMNFEKNQPRFTFRLPLGAGRDAVYDALDRMAKKNLKLADEAAITVYKSDDLERYFEIMRDTAERDDFYEGAPDYFRRLYPMLHRAGMAQLWFAKYEPKENLRLIDGMLAEIAAEKAENEKKMAVKRSPRLETRNTQLDEKAQRVRKQRAEAAQWLESHPDGIDLSTLITVSTPHRMWTVWGGSRSRLRQLAANYKITWAAIEEACENGREFADFFGSTGDPRPDNPITGIYAFKKKFSGLYTEFPGEFYLVTDAPLYSFWRAFSPLALKLRRMLRRRA